MREMVVLIPHGAPHPKMHILAEAEYIFVETSPGVWSTWKARIGPKNIRLVIAGTKEAQKSLLADLWRNDDA